ncbi:30S ribosomal protein S1 [Candidatus Bandiella euplotis]|uniref:30S ribosomal protein S1 n=1 Tax=Candidatus Bandiella euplotis TaxID=1664265 RepID=A0ABZ0UNK1_9RICK|nr:30S ribosomal protein S1 [Candidatus Bandiella woodruffii]WPX96420.1 30S ribosomal protein S1 [Candidatus Bandiella woodruffii]
MNIESITNFSKESFAQLLEEKLQYQPKESSIVRGKVVMILGDVVFVDVGLKSEGRISINEFAGQGVKVGDEVDVYIERVEGRNGCTQLSKEKVERERVWNKLEEIYAKGDNVNGKIIGKVSKGGFAVEIEGILAFLPGSQLDIRSVKDISVLIDIEQPFKVLKIDREQGNVVVSRRAILEESRKEAKDEILAGIKEGMIFDGTVKNITAYGAFVDLGDIDGLLHITDISWNKITHPSEKITLGQEIKVIVTKYNAETKRVSLGLKQLSDNPWKGLEQKYAVGTKHKGKVSSVLDYGVFIELQKDVEGLVYLNEIDWNTKNTHPTKLLQVNDEVETVVLDIDIEKHRISLSIKQCTDNPWKQFATQYPIGTVVEAKVKKIADFGLFVHVIDGDKESELDILVPAVEISFDDNPRNALKDYKIGDTIKGVILSSDLERERITVSIKQLQEGDHQKVVDQLVKSKIITCKVLEVTKDGLVVEAEGVKGFVKRFDLSRHKDQQKPERFTVDDRIDAKVVSYDKSKKMLNLSVKALEIDEEKKAIAEYGSVDSGASLGDILGAALEQQNKGK